DVAGIGLFDVLAVVRVHQQHAADLLALVLDRVQHRSLGELARVDAGEGQRAYERIVHDLERERGERRVVARRTAVFLVAVGLDALDRRNVDRARQIIDHRVEQRLNALVLERRAARDRNEALVQRALADQPLQRRDVGLVALEIGFHDLVVLLDGELDQLFTVLGRLVGQLGRNLDEVELRAEAFLVPDDRAVVDQVDQALEVGLGADRQIQYRRRGTETVDDRLHAVVEVGPGAVELVDVAHARHAVLLGLAPHGFGLRLDAGNAVERGDRTVEDAQRTLDLDGEVDVAGSVDDVEAMLLALAVIGAPEGRRRGRRDGDPALLLLLHPVHRRGAVVDFADLVGLAGVVEDAFGRGGLAGIDVGHDADVAIALQRVLAGHVFTPEFRFAPLPAVVREGAVGVGHAVRVFAFLDRVAAVVGGVHQLGREARGHGRLGTAAGGGDQPAHGERLGALGTNLDRHLVGGTADPARAH